MGQSTDAYLFYGITADYEYDVFSMAEALGHDVNEDDNEYFDFDDLAKLECLDAVGLDIFTHGSCDYAIPAIGCEKLTAHRGYPTDVPLHLPLISSEADEALRELAEKLGWAAPRWILASDLC